MRSPDLLPAGILFLGAVLVWLAAGAMGPWPLAAVAGLALPMAALVTALARRARLADAEGVSMIARAGAALFLYLRQAPRRIGAMIGVCLTALGFRPLRPAFVRLRLKPASAAGLASAIQSMSAQPGLVVVDADAGSLLAHALDEPGIDVPALQRLERDAARGQGGPA